MAAEWSEAITSFSTKIEVEPSQSIRVTETIVYDTTLAKHGIFRYIPIRYEREGKTVSLPPHSFKVIDETGDSIPFTRASDGKNVTLKIGKAQETFTGSKTYIISYQVNEALEETDQGLRLYWDITGEGWAFPILKSKAEVVASGTIKAITCYSGAFGTNDRQCSFTQTDSHAAEFSYPLTINPGDNFTIDIQFDGTTGFIVLSPVQKTLRTLLSYWWVIIFVLPPLLIFKVWYSYGRDYMFSRYNPHDHSKRHEILKPILMRITPPFVYEPLDISPGQAGAMLDESYDNHDLVADILDLARLKIISIKQLQAKKLFKSADYEFHLLSEKYQKLPEHQQIIIEGLFSGGKVVKLSELKGKFYLHIPRIQQAVFKELFSHTMFTRNPWEFKKSVGAISIAVVVLLFVLWQVLVPFLFTVLPVVPITILAIMDLIIVFIFISRMTQKTGKGFNYMLQAQGLRETILRGKWREEIKEKHLFIEEVLPFAVSLNVVDKLSKDMKALGIEPPNYVGSRTGNWVTTSAFVNSFSSEVASGLSYNPSSSSGGGGSFGGGSSGGGGGGGGGGSW